METEHRELKVTGLRSPRPTSLLTLYHGRLHSQAAGVPWSSLSEGPGEGRAVAQTHPPCRASPCVTPRLLGCSPSLSIPLPWDTVVWSSESESPASGDLGRFWSLTLTVL